MPGFSLVTLHLLCFGHLLWALINSVVTSSNRQCYAQLTLFPGPNQKQVGEDSGNEAKAQLPAAVRELRSRQNEPRPEGAADRPEGAVGN